MYSQSITTPTIEKLHADGLHFVRCREKDVGSKRAKAALDSGWQKRAAISAIPRNGRAVDAPQPGE